MYTMYIRWLSIVICTKLIEDAYKYNVNVNIIVFMDFEIRFMWTTLY